MFRLANNEDIHKLRALWALSFTSDESFLDFFFQKCFPISNTYILSEGDTIISALTVIDCIYEDNLNNQMLHGAYIYGVCTDPNFRGKSYMRKLMLLTEKYLSNNKYDFCFLRPASDKLFEYYRSLGYNNSIYNHSVEAIISQGNNTSPIEDLSPEKLNVLRGTFYNKHPYIKWNTEVLSYIISYYQRENGLALESLGDYIIAYPVNYESAESSPEKEDLSSNFINILEYGNKLQSIEDLNQKFASTLKFKYSGIAKIKINNYRFYTIDNPTITCASREEFALFKYLNKNIKLNENLIFSFPLE